MIFSGLDQIPFRILALVIVVTVHEASHALASYIQGDTTARQLGRLTLNPIKHMDPLGTLMIMFAGFGWGKPVPVNTFALRNGRLGMGIVAAAGPLSNLITATIAMIPIRLGLASPIFIPGFTDAINLGPEFFLGSLLLNVVILSIWLAVFNLIPIFPLDGFNVTVGILPTKYAWRFARLEKYGPGILMLIIGTDFILGVGILHAVLFPVLEYLYGIIL